MVTTWGCKHHQKPIKVGSHTIYGSSYSWILETWKAGETPDLLVALSDCWLGDGGGIYTCGVPEPLPIETLPTIYVEWADQKALPMLTLNWLVGVIQKRLWKNEKIEVGCMGGHGRTGTLLACLLGAEESLKPRAAIKELRNRYCGKAVETMAQIRQVYLFLGESTERANQEWTTGEVKQFDLEAWRKEHNIQTNFQYSY